MADDTRKDDLIEDADHDAERRAETTPGRWSNDDLSGVLNLFQQPQAQPSPAGTPTAAPGTVPATPNQDAIRAALGVLSQSPDQNTAQAVATAPAQGQIPGIPGIPGMAQAASAPNPAAPTADPTQSPATPAPLDQPNQVQGYDKLSPDEKNVDKQRQVEYSDAQKASDAELASQRDLVNRKADVDTASVKQMQQADADLARAQAARHAKSDYETAQSHEKIEEAIAKEPDPGRYWHNKSNFSKAMWGLSLALGAVGAGATGTNAGAEMLNKAVADDVGQQKDTRNKLISEYGDQIKDSRDRDDRDSRDFGNNHSNAIARYTSLMKVAEERSQAPGTMQQQAARAKLRLDLNAARTQHLAAYAHDARESSDKAAERSMQWGIASNHDKNAYDIAKMNDDSKEDVVRLKNENAGLKAGQAEAAGYISPEHSGLTVRNVAAGKTRAANVSTLTPEQKIKFNEELATGSRQYNGANRLLKAMKSDDYDKVAGLLNNDADVRAAYASYIEPEAKAVQIRLGKSNLPLLSEQAAGFDTKSFVQRAAQLIKDDGKTGFIKRIEARRDQDLNHTRNTLGSYPGVVGPGETLAWSPIDETPPDEGVLSDNERATSASGQHIERSTLHEPVGEAMTKEALSSRGETVAKSLPGNQTTPDGKVKEGIRTPVVTALESLDAHNLDSEGVEQVVKDASAAIDAYAARPDADKDAVADARLVLDAHKHQAVAKTLEHFQDAAKRLYGEGTPDYETAAHALQEAGTTDKGEHEVYKLIDDVKAMNEKLRDSEQYQPRVTF